MYIIYYLKIVEVKSLLSVDFNPSVLPGKPTKIIYDNPNIFNKNDKDDLTQNI